MDDPGIDGPAQTPPPPVNAPVANVLSGGAPAPVRRSRTRLVAVAVAAVAGLGLLAAKYLLPLVLVGVAGEVLGSVFGGPYQRLPSDVRQGFEQRLAAALGDQLEGLSDDAQAQKIRALLDGGMPRLDDTTVELHYRLTSGAFERTDPSTCATVARSLLAGTPAPSDATTRMIDALTVDELRQWFDIQVRAIEAEIMGTPDAVTVSDATVEPMYAGIAEAMTEADLATFNAMGTGSEVDDPAVCSAARGLYRAVLNRPREEIVVWARYDISP